jgi:CubicO group peptidase (beta-lactamase class C family)
VIGRRAFLIAAGGTLLAGRVQAWAQGQTNFRARSGAADRLVEEFAHATGVSDFSVVVMRGERQLYERYMGAFGPSTTLNIASASKWLVGATAMSLVAEKRLRLDEPVGAYVPGLPADYADLRLDQLLSYTAGLASLQQAVDIVQPRYISLTRSAQLAARAPLASTPGTQFDYGGANLQFIGAADEQVTGRRWQAVFDERIAGPLGMRETLWGRGFLRPRRWNLPANPLLQGAPGRPWATTPHFSL